MSHPIIYLLGNTETEAFPLILTIGREPNYDDKLIDIIEKLDLEEFKSMSGGVWVTAYTQIAKQYWGPTGTSGQLKSLCFSKNSSPILFSNAFPDAIPNSVHNKQELREKLAGDIPSHIINIFSKKLIERVAIVIQHGADKSEPSTIATNLIKEQCEKRGIRYISSPFLYNGNSPEIQDALAPAQKEIAKVLDNFLMP